jgi:uncharacterized damage-inducible protein DinB
MAAIGRSVATMTTSNTLTAEQTDLLQTLARHRFFLRNTTRDMSEEQIRQRSTVSELTLAKLIKHLVEMERQWVDFIVEGPSAMGDFPREFTPEMIAAWAERWEVPDDVTLADLLAEYDQVARRTEEIVAALPDLNAAHPLPSAPWFEPGAKWSARRVLLHLIAETSQHAGHADIIREAIDGAKSMG